MRKKIILSLSIVLLLGASYIGWQVYRAGGIQGIISSACSKSCEYQGNDFDKNASLVVSQPGANVGDFTKCPYSNVMLKVSEESSFYMYNDKKYYTCCGTCLGFIEKNPEKYLAALTHNENEE